MAERRTQESFKDVLPDLLREVGKSRRQALQEAGLDPSLFSKALRGVGGKRLNAEMIRRLSGPLGVPPEYFAEVREEMVVDRVRTDPGLREQVFDELAHGERRPRRRSDRR